MLAAFGMAWNAIGSTTQSAMHAAVMIDFLTEDILFMVKTLLDISSRTVAAVQKTNISQSRSSRQDERSTAPKAENLLATLLPKTLSEQR